MLAPSTNMGWVLATSRSVRYPDRMDDDLTDEHLSPCHSPFGEHLRQPIRS